MSGRFGHQRCGLPIGLVLLVGPALASACNRGTGYESDQRASPSASGSALELDGMQLASARRVAIESATAAMRRRDLPRLKQLSVWVRGRAQVAILEVNDLKALDVAIQCLEQVAPPTDAAATLDALGSGALLKPAREACAGVGGK